LPPFRYLSSDGFAIVAGSNNVQNDQSPSRKPRSGDIWLHDAEASRLPRGDPDRRECLVPDRTLEEAAVIAAGIPRPGTGVKGCRWNYTFIKYG
jgi:predicted ribosome quality control (RQC) complex YloA/Tae2 family protein